MKERVQNILRKLENAITFLQFFLKKEIKNFADIVNKIRPNICVLAIMEEMPESDIKKIRDKIKPDINLGIKVEIMSLKKEHFSSSSYLYN